MRRSRNKMFIFPTSLHVPPPLTPMLSARAERMEWWKGWLPWSGAFPLRKAWELEKRRSMPLY